MIERASMAEIRAAIRSLEHANLAEVSIDEIKDLLTPLFRGHRLTVPRFEAGLAIYRGRVNLKAQNIAEVTYPPPESARLNRANRENEPLFYGATARNVVFFEAKLHPGDTLTLTRWRATHPLLLNLCGFTADAFRKVESNRAVPDYGLQAEAPENEFNSFITAYFADLFMEVVDETSSDRYKLTAAIAEKHLSSDLFGGLMYPTVPMKANAENVALKPTYVDQHLKLECAEFIAVKKEYDFKYDIDVLDTADHWGGDGEIIWKGHGDRWTLGPGQQLTLTAEEDGYVARDQANNVVPPDP